MGAEIGGSSEAQLIERVLGYLNFSSGTEDLAYLAALDQCFCFHQDQPGNDDTAIWFRVTEYLQQHLGELRKSSAAFAEADQAETVLSRLVDFGPAYLEYHRDLLSHIGEDELFNSYFVGRVTEVLLQLNGVAEGEAAIQLAIRKTNDYLGFRPVATLESQKIEPYDHEWIRPIPIYIQDAGVAQGRYHDVTKKCLHLLASTAPNLLRQAYFDPNRLHELAIDPRAYDFDHPANKRPNHHFGQWDPHRIDGDGFYTRFVVQKVTMDSLFKRIEEVDAGMDDDELIFEAAAVLAGTILMSSGISGFGPETHASTVSLAQLLTVIANYRDSFYDQLLASTGGAHGARLKEEAARLQQPFAAARQDLNRQLTESRAIQLQRVHLTRIFAKMNYRDEAFRQAELIQVPAARITAQMDCELTSAKNFITTGDLGLALKSIEEARQSMLRGIECGAIVDPWNILGFNANFGLFGPIENSLHDYRIDDLIDTVEEMHELYASLWCKAAASQSTEVENEAKAKFHEFARWWHKFAAHELDVVDAEDPLEVFQAAGNVAQALQAWHAAGETSGDIRFWSPHVQEFDSCRAYWLVVNTLLERDDKVASLGLLMHWLSQSDRIPLEHGETSFFRLSLRWLAAALHETGSIPEDGARTGWLRIKQFFDYLEANAGEFWEIPKFEPDAGNGHPEREYEEPLANEGEEEEEDDRFSAAYENVVYRDSTDDGIDGSVFDYDTHDQDYLQQASRPIATHLSFVEQLALVWRLIAVTWSAAKASKRPDAMDATVVEQLEQLLSDARDHLTQTSIALGQLLRSVSSYRLSKLGADPESMVNYDRLRLLKDSLLDQIVNSHVSVTEALRFLSACVGEGEQETDDADQLACQVLRACLLGDPQTAQQTWPRVRSSMKKFPILYVPLNRGGRPEAIVAIRARQQVLQNLLFWLPRVGLLKETYQLLELIRLMEATPVGQGAITEFDDLFDIGCSAIVNALVDVKANNESSSDDEDWLIANLEDVMEPMLRSWLSHSRTLRLSVLEQMDDSEWRELTDFIRRFGRDLFTQRFLNLGNLRGILHQGVGNWLTMIVESEEEDYQSLIDALEHDVDREELVEKLTLIFEAIVENYSEYRDYNSTTTQSDRGDLLFTLLDFLRLRVSYDRVVWNLRPVVLAHQVLATRGCKSTAEQWRRSLQERIRGEAKRHMMRLAELQQKYAMRLPSVSKRLGEKFMRPLLVDYLCSLIEPAMFHENESARETAFDRIRELVETFLQEPSGAGLDVPTWLISMEDTIRFEIDNKEGSLQQLVEDYMLPSVKMSVEELQKNVRSWTKDAN